MSSKLTNYRRKTGYTTPPKFRKLETITPPPVETHILATDPWEDPRGSFLCKVYLGPNHSEQGVKPSFSFSWPNGVANSTQITSPVSSWPVPRVRRPDVCAGIASNVGDEDCDKGWEAGLTGADRGELIIRRVVAGGPAAFSCEIVSGWQEVARVF
eukprot:747532-Hanusia_phi.AAC.3